MNVMSLVLFHKIRKVDVDLVRVVSKSKHWTWRPHLLGPAEMLALPAAS
jgi:hypothetical protein